MVLRAALDALAVLPETVCPKPRRGNVHVHKRKLFT